MARGNWQIPVSAQVLATSTPSPITQEDPLPYKRSSPGCNRSITLWTRSTNHLLQLSSTSVSQLHPTAKGPLIACLFQNTIQHLQHLLGISIAKVQNFGWSFQISACMIFKQIFMFIYFRVNMDFTPHHNNRRGLKYQAEYLRRKKAVEKRQFNASLHSSGMWGHSFHRPPTYPTHPTPSHAPFSPFVPPPASPTLSNSSFLFPESGPTRPIASFLATACFDPLSSVECLLSSRYTSTGLLFSPSWTCLHPISLNGRRLMVNFVVRFFPMAPPIAHCLLQNNFIFIFSSVDSRHEESQLMTPPHHLFQEQEEPLIVGKLLFLSSFFVCNYWVCNSILKIGL